MANNINHPMTEQGKEKLKQKLTHLKKVKRSEVVERIKHARSFCDFSEDSEYDAAMKEQASVEERILTLEQMIHHAKIIKVDHETSDIVTLGKPVTFREVPDGEEEAYTIVGKAEADPLEGKISNDSPMAKSLVGHKVNDIVVVRSPGGDIKVEIIKVN